MLGLCVRTWGLKFGFLFQGLRQLRPARCKRRLCDGVLLRRHDAGSTRLVQLFNPFLPQRNAGSQACLVLLAGTKQRGNRCGGVPRDLDNGSVGSRASARCCAETTLTEATNESSAAMAATGTSEGTCRAAPGGMPVVHKHEWSPCGTGSPVGSCWWCGTCVS